MVVKRFRSQQGDIEADSSQARPLKKPASRKHRRRVIAAVILVTLSLLLLMAGPRWSQSLGFPCRKGINERIEDDSFAPPSALKDELLGGLLAPGFDEPSCLSRYRSALYRKPSPHLPSPHLQERLRDYEALHRKCGPSTELYNKSIERLSSNRSTATECNYVVWTPVNGLGNRMVTLASTFLYALLTDRVLLVDMTDDMSGLFCEPFPNTSWVLPRDFPLLSDHKGFGFAGLQTYGSMAQNAVVMISSSTNSLPSSVLLQLTSYYDEFDQLFFCDDDQRRLSEVPWLVLVSDNYFAPGLFLMPSFEEELNRLFPAAARETVFHHLVRYLFHPTNSVWGMITSYYDADLARADERVGIQIRVFKGIAPISLENMFKQVLSCSLKEGLLPEPAAPAYNKTATGGSKAVLITSLYARFYKKMKAMYSGETISVHQPSHEGEQKTQDQTHNQKAWAEMCLLSFSDVLVTTAWSTFGYVAQGLGGLRPWVLLSPANKKVPDPPCRRASSMEPCFHSPPTGGCNARRRDDAEALLARHVRPCEDVDGGIRLFD